MADKNKTKAQLINELKELRTCIASLEASKVERILDEREVGEAEEIYKILVDLSPDPIVILQDDRFQFVCQAFNEVFGYTQKDIQGGLSLFALVQEHDKESVRRRFEERLEGKQVPKTYRIDLITKEGVVVPCETSARMIHYKGKPADLVLIRDITERKQLEKILRKSEESYRAVVEDQTELICRFLPDKTLTFINSAYCRYFDVKRDELIGSSFMRLIPESDHESVENHFASLSLENPLATHEHQVMAPNGEIRWQQWTNRAIFDDEGRIIEFQSVGRDITERKLMEEALRASKERYELAVAGSTDGLWDLDILSDTVFYADRFKELLGYLPDEFSSTVDSFRNHLHPEDADVTWTEVERHLEKRFPYDREYRLRTKSGDYRWFHARGQALWDKEGKATRMSGSIQDIAERKLMEEALKKSEEELRLLSSHLLSAQEDERSWIAYELHEELGTSLANIKVRLEALIKQATSKTDTASVELLQDLVSVVQKSLEEVRNVSMALRPTTLDVLGILATITWFCRQFQKEYPDIRIEKEIDIQEDGVAESLKINIYRIIQEAFHNVGKHSKADTVRVCLQKTDGVIELVIEDNGRGFDIEEALSVEASKRGFGLGIMKERTELSGGTFVIDSVKTRGTIVRASWPTE
jgi:PAS domain S-box-containing protein